jgi:diguanylate cyclase (GGDEF)-like protein
MGNDSTVITVINKPPEKDSSGQEACLVVINGVDLGKKYSLAQSATVIGRSSKVDIQIDEDAISRSHAIIDNLGDNFVARDLDSTNGTYVNDTPISRKTLTDGDQVKIGRTIFKFLTGSNIEASYHDEIYRLTTTDGLTQVYNKRYFLKEMEREMSRSIRYDRDLSLVMCDIDHFKPINDTYGHLAGDHVLRQVAQRIVGHIRRDDVFARYGGEEFVIMLPEIDKQQAVGIAEKIRKIIAAEPFNFDNVSIPVTMSMGVADLEEYQEASDVPATNQTADINCFAFIKLADDRLYEAKESGRNKVVGDSND